MATVAATKTVSFKAPYTGATFQGLTGLLMGRDGYISGGLTTDNGSTVTVQPTVFLQRGLVVQSLVAATGIPVPTAAEPWFLLASTPDDDPDSGAVFTATADLGTAAASVIVAFKSNGIWTSPVGVNVAAAAERDSDSGGEEDLGIADLRSVAGLVTSISAYKGLVVDPSGKRRPLPNITANSAKALDQAPVRPNSLFDRNDHVVLRQLEPFSPEIRTLIGGAVGDDAPIIVLESGGGVDRPSYVAKRGGGPADQWWAWGNGTNLKIKGGPAGEAFATTTLLTSGAITSTHLAGQRASDSAVLLLYVDGADLRLVSFNAATGVQINAPVTLEALSGQVSHVRAVLDRNEKLHIAFEHDEGARQQIYYTKVRVVTGAGFGTAEVSPQIVNGVDSGLNDTWPSIGIDRRGTVTVAHTRGAGSDEFGNLVVATIDQNGDTVSQETIFAATDVGIDPGVPDDTQSNGVGASFLAFLNVRRAAVVVTPHDELYVFTIGLSSGAFPNYLLAHSPNFQRDHGFKLLNINADIQIEDPGYSIVGLDADAGEAGEICLAFKQSIPAGPFTQIKIITFGTPLWSSGRLPETPDIENSFHNVASHDSFSDVHIRRGPLGEFVPSYMITTSATTVQLATVQRETTIPRHPKDLYLGTWRVPKALSTTLDGHGKRFEVFNTRLKKMNYPIVVGQNGDYQGFGSIAGALAGARRMGGGTIVLRNGIHRSSEAIRLSSGLSIRGEGSTTLVLDDTELSLGHTQTSALTVSGNVVTLSSGSDFGAERALPGDIIDLNTSGQHVVLRNLGRHPSSGLWRFLVENNAAGVPVGTSGNWYSSGCQAENLTIVQTVANGLIGIERANRPVLRNIRLEGPCAGQFAVEIEDCLDLLIDGLDLTRLVNTDADVSLRLDTTQGGVFRGLKFADGKGTFNILLDAQNLHLIGCSSDGADATKVIYEIDAGRTTPIFMSSCEGRISATAPTLAFLITNVGKRMRLPEGGGALELEDDNTRASTITDDGIKLTSATHKQFDGVSTDVITDAVNERVKVGGDTMTGPMVFAAGDERVKVVGDTMTGTLTGTQVALGATLLATAANARLPRVSVTHSGTHIVTLLLESLRDAAGIATRLYSTSDNKTFVTVNASFDGTNWNKDTAGQLATQFMWLQTGSEQFFREADAAWTVWTKISKVSGPRTTSLTPAAPFFDPLLELFDSGGSRHVAFDHLGFPGGGLIVIRQPWLTGAAGIDTNPDGWELVETGTGDVNQAGNIPEQWRGVYLATIGAAAATAKVKTKYPFIQFDVSGVVTPYPDIVAIVEWEGYSWNAAAASPGNEIQMGFDADNYAGNDSTVNFRKEEGNINWKFVIQNDAGSTTKIDTGVAILNGIQKFRIEMYGANAPGGRRYLGFINGVLVAEHLAAAANYPDRDLGLVFQNVWVAGAPNKIYSIGPVYCVVTQRPSDYAL